VETGSDVRGVRSRLLNTGLSAMGHEGQFAPPRLSGRSAFSEETFAGRCGNEKDAPRTDVRRDDRRLVKSTLCGPSS